MQDWFKFRTSYKPLGGNVYLCEWGYNIEVDEPYNRDTKFKWLIGSDSEKRDVICSENNLFVLRFTESQVTYALSECVSIVKLVLFTQRSANTQHLLNIRSIKKHRSSLLDKGVVDGFEWRLKVNR